MPRQTNKSIALPQYRNGKCVGVNSYPLVFIIQLYMHENASLHNFSQQILQTIPLDYRLVLHH